MSVILCFGFFQGRLNLLYLLLLVQKLIYLKQRGRNKCLSISEMLLRLKDFLPWSLETIFKTIQLKTVLRQFYILLLVVIFSPSNDRAFMIICCLQSIRRYVKFMIK